MAREINYAHREVQRYAKGLLFETRQAGDALLKAKEEGKRSGKVPHGRFQAWVEANTRAGIRMAQKSMKVAALTKDDDAFAFQDGIDTFLGAHAEPKPDTNPKVNTSAFNTADAEHVQKLHAMAAYPGR